VVADAPHALGILPVDPPVALAFLEQLEVETGIPPVDEDEQRRLAGHASVRDRSWDWGAHLVTAQDTVVAYAGTRLPPAEVATGHDAAPADAGPIDAPGSPVAARVDLALDRSHAAAADALGLALEDARDHAARSARSARAARSALGGAPVVQAWLRGATEEDLAAARHVGFEVTRRLHVLGVALPVRAPGGAASIRAADESVRVRPYRADAADRRAVAELLAAVYPGSEGAWDEAGVAVRESRAWFRAEDLLLLEEHGADATLEPGAVAGTNGDRRPLVGLHWTKRRSAELGEVHNLAVHPDAHGRGYGPLLLDAGLAHLTDVGSREVVLWVDSTNTRALDLYRSRGFATRWDDVALSG
jgi:mycothiol synthase